MKNPFVSVIITTKNEEKNIGNCLRSVKNQDYPADRLEIIVVDNNSTDKTKEIAKEYTSSVYIYGPERSAQRNFGVKKSWGEFFLYLDADMILSPKVITECVEAIQSNQGVIALFIPEIVMGTKFFSVVRRFERSFYNATLIDAVRFIRKDIFLKLGGFDENITGFEDWDLTKRFKKEGKLDIIKTPLYHNEKYFNLRKYLSKKDYYGVQIEPYIKKWGREDVDLKKQLGFYYRFLGVFIENGKWKKLMAHPILTLGMYFLRFLVGLRYLIKR